MAIISSKQIGRRDAPLDHDGWIWGVSLASIIFVTLICLIRIWSRLLNRSQRFGADDWMALAAWPFIVAQNAGIMVGMKWGLGEHTSDLSAEQSIKSNQLLFAVIVLYYFNIDFIRISLSLYYRRIFASAPTFKYFVYGNIVINVLWHIAITIAATFQCTNPAAMWDPSVEAHCNPPMTHQYFCASSSVILDLVALLLPVPMIWKLQLKPSKKRELFAIFFVGYCVPILTMGRLIATLLYRNELDADPSYNWMTVILWIPFESTLGYLGVCMPAVLFLYRRCRSSGIRALFTRHATPRAAVVAGQGNAFDKLAQYADPSNAKHQGQSLVTSASSTTEETDITSSMMGIVQTRSYTVTRDSI